MEVVVEGRGQSLVALPQKAGSAQSQVEPRLVQVADPVLDEFNLYAPKTAVVAHLQS